jgi:hypothetical protein
MLNTYVIVIDLIFFIFDFLCRSLTEDVLTSSVQLVDTGLLATSKS